MKYIEIGGIDRACSQLILGTSSFSLDRRALSFKMLDAFVEQGGNTIDTAYLYGQGNAELTLGMWLEERQNRKDMIIISKGGHHFVNKNGLHDGQKKRVNTKDITHDLMISLERLKTDYIDLYLLHRDDPSVPVEILMDMLQDFKNSGHIKAFGVSNWSTERIEEANKYADKKGYNRLLVNSPSFSLAQINEPRWPGTVYVDKTDLKWHKKMNFPLFSWASQASGFFTGRFSPEDKSNKDIVRVYYNDTNWERFRRANELAKQKGTKYKANHIALAFVLNQSFPSCAVIGPQNIEELNSSIQALEIQLTSEEKRWINVEDSNIVTNSYKLF
ncbi:aldo/keto reductase [Priestia endophytica]|uniref:Aldo/keto reductase n=1 Tax=Priestia endophytica TaxID=135735 RepID=A0AAX1QEQ7_9BACI|nr:aldo/keto reductase [Priestia endophytica]RAS81152.1 aldo/keto reductase [Priestia endophytica]RAS91109.1 aldo/keto reductase [Priestia endophytica]